MTIPKNTVKDKKAIHEKFIICTNSLIHKYTMIRSPDRGPLKISPWLTSGPWPTG